MGTTLKIAEILTKLMKRSGVTLRELSKATKVPVSSLSEWRKNNRSPDPEQAVKIAKHFGVTLHYLLFGTEDEQEPIQMILKEEFFKGTFEITLKKVKMPDE